MKFLTKGLPQIDYHALADEFARLPEGAWFDAIARHKEIAEGLPQYLYQPALDSAVFKDLLPRLPFAPVSAYYSRLLPGVRIGIHCDKHCGLRLHYPLIAENCVFYYHRELKGDLTITDRHTYRPGEAVVIDSSVPHSVQNHSAAVTKLALIVSFDKGVRWEDLENGFGRHARPLEA